jgi:serine/threonine protein kinase
LALTPGTRLGAYEVTAAIGVGGMGQVYRARDTKLNRDVALKLLPDAFASDPDRLARFTRKAADAKRPTSTGKDEDESVPETVEIDMETEDRFEATDN